FLFKPVDRPGSRTPISWVQTRRLPIGPAALLPNPPQGSARESNPDHLLTREACRRNTCGPSSRIARVGVEPTDTRLSAWPLCPFAYRAVARHNLSSADLSIAGLLVEAPKPSSYSSAEPWPTRENHAAGA